jgi:hypothetical protein
VELPIETKEKVAFCEVVEMGELINGVVDAKLFCWVIKIGELTTGVGIKETKPFGT